MRFAQLPPGILVERFGVAVVVGEILFEVGNLPREIGFFILQVTEQVAERRFDVDVRRSTDLCLDPVD